MAIYNEYRINSYDIPIMINQFIKIVKKYPSILSRKDWLENDELVSFFDNDGNLKPIETLMKIETILTKYFVASDEFLSQNNRCKLQWRTEAFYK